MFQGRSLGINHCGNLLFHANSCLRARCDWTGSAYALFGLRLVSHAGDLLNSGVLWLVKKKERGVINLSYWSDKD